MFIIRSYLFSIRINLLIVLVVAICFPAFAQLNANITRYTTANGLSHAGVLCTIKDRDGFMWFGTFDGLNRFDGQNFVIYKSRPGDQSNLKSNKIRNIVEDRQGYLWVETYDNKIYRFDKKKEQFIPVSEGKFKSIFNDQLVINRIIADDKNGVWLLTEADGLFYARTDANQMPIVSHFAKTVRNPQKLKGNIVEFFDKDRNGNVWIGTNGGLDRLKRNSFGGYETNKFAPSLERLSNTTSFTAMAKTDRKLFFGTGNGGLVTYNLNDQTFEHKKLDTTRFNAICYAKSGLIYLSTSSRGLMVYDEKAGKLKPSSSPVANYLSLYEDKSGQIWIEPKTSGIVKYNPKTGQYKRFMQQKDLASSSRGYEVMTDVNGILWARMKDGGFGYYDPISDEIKYFYNKPGAADQKFSNIINSFYSDNTGVLWVCAKDGGINKIVLLKDRFNFRKVNDQPQSRAQNEVRAIIKDSKNRLWLSTKDGQLHVFEGNRKVNVFNTSVKEIGFVYCITEDRKGNIWLGTKGNGLFKAVPQDASKQFYTLKHYQNRPRDVSSLSNDMVYSVIESANGQIWVGTFGGGINLYTETAEGATFKNYFNAYPNYPFSWAKVVRHLCEDDAGRIWIGTSNGLLVFDPKRYGKNQFLAFRKISGDKSSLGSNSVQHIYKAANRQMWLGTFGGGLNRAIVSSKDKDHISFEPFTIDDGLGNDVVLGITGDQQHNLWIATESGLTSFNPKERVFKNYDAYDGLSKAGFSESAAFTAKDGKIYFGCIDGYISFIPTSVDERKSAAKMALTRIQLYYKDILLGVEGSPLKESINETSSLVLNYDQNVISLDYGVLDYKMANKVSYAYKLEGFDENWHMVNDQRKATYTNIPPGEYTFKVRAANGYLFTKVPEKSLKVVVSRSNPQHALYSAAALAGAGAGPGFAGRCAEP